jgi:hypothetical protein
MRLQMRARMLKLAVVVPLCAFCASLILAAPAGAALVRKFEAGFGPDGTSASAFAEPGPVAVDQSSGEVLVGDVGAGTIERFDAAHEPVAFTGALNPSIVEGKLTGISFRGAGENELAVDDDLSSPAARDVYVVTGANKIDAFQADGEPALFTEGPDAGSNELGGFGNVCGVAVDLSGDIYVGDSNSGVDVFSAAGEPITSFSAPGACKLAVDSSGDVYVAFYGSSGVGELVPSSFPVSSSTSYSQAGTLDEGGAVASVAADPTSGHVFLDDSNQLVEYGQAGELLETFAHREPGTLSESEGVAVNASSDQVYAADRQGNRQVDVFAEITTPDVAAAPASDVTVSSATLNGTVNPEDTTITKCFFEYGTTTSYGQIAACVPASPSGISPVTITAAVSGLTEGTVYHFRLVAANANAVEDGADETFNTGPLILGAGAVNVGAHQANLESTIEVLGDATTYHFEYGTTTEYGTNAPIPDASLGTSANQQTALTVVTGLAPETTYHFRVVVTSSAGASDGLDQTFTTPASSSATCPNARLREVGPSADLPDCRAFELVTPADKLGSGDIYAAGGTVAAVSEDGSRVYLSTSQASFGPHPGPTRNAYVFSRSHSGWTVENSYPAGGIEEHSNVQLFSPDLSHLALETFVLPQEEATYVAGPVGGSYTQIVGKEPLDENEFVGASSDFSHLVFWSHDHTLAPYASAQVPGSGALYDWSDGQLHLVNVNTDGSLTNPCGAALGDLTPEEGTIEMQYGEAHNAVSSDGSKIFFVSPDPTTREYGATDPSCEGAPQLYMRDSATATTVDISCPAHVPDPDSCGRATYVGASADGSRVFFTTSTELTADALGTGHDEELYEYDTQTGALARVSRGASGTAAGEVEYALPSADGSTVYIVAAGVLAPGGSPGLGHVYRYDTATGKTTYVAFGVQTNCGNECYRAHGYDSEHQFYTTPDGRFLLFGSTATLTGYQNTTERYQELYLYDSADGRLVCVSCNPSGAPQTPPSNKISGVSVFNAEGAKFSDFIGTSVDQAPPRPMSDDGSYVFFMSYEKLVPQATNEQVDVYEWHDGQISLISGGVDPTSSVLIGTSPDGHDAYFLTAAKLVAQDTDEEDDIYDARIDGGFPEAGPPCSGEGCQGAPSAAPAMPVIVTFDSGAASQAQGSPPRASVKVLDRSVKGHAFLLTVAVPGGGVLTISGAGVSTVRRQFAAAGTYRLKVTLTAAERRTLARRHRLKLRLRVGYAPASGEPSTAAVFLTVRR